MPFDLSAGCSRTVARSLAAWPYRIDGVRSNVERFVVLVVRWLPAHVVLPGSLKYVRCKDLVSESAGRGVPALKLPRRDGVRSVSVGLTPEDFRALVQSGPELVAVLGDGAVFRYGSPALAAMLECDPDELVGRSAFEFVDARDTAPLAGALATVAEGRPAGPVGLRVRRPQGSERVFRSTVTPFRDCRGQSCAVLRSAVVAPDGPRRADESPLVRLPDRAAVEERLDRSIRRATFRTDYLFAVLVVAVDRLELINDTYGLAARDQLLVQLADRLVGAVRPGDQVAYLGQGEFSVLVDRIGGPDDTVTVARRIQTRVSEPFRLDDDEAALTVSLGIALSGGARSPAELLNDGATAMRRAQAAGPGRYEFFDPTMRLRALARLKLETDLRLGAGRQEFHIHYQPIVSLRTGEMAGVEALLRWQHPERGLLAPAAFISAAEETGLIVPISSQVLLDAAVQVRAWQQRFPQDPPLSLSMNFTGTHFSEGAVITVISDILERTGLDGSSLVVEITERVLLQDVEKVMAVLAELRQRRIHVHLDDFGTGYSSLSYLQRLPVDALKIDRSFVSGLGRDQHAMVMLRAIVDLAHSLGKHVIAEGIETEAQAAAMQALQCDYGQGYYYARPAEATAVEALLVNRSGHRAGK